MKHRCVRQGADFIMGLILLILAIVLISVDVTNGAEAMLNKVGHFVSAPIALPGIYVNLAAWLLLFLSVALILRSVRLPHQKSADNDAERITIHLNSAAVTTMITLVVYVIVMPKVGFYLSTTALCAVISFSFSVKEKHLDGKDKKQLVKSAMLSLVFAACAVAVLQFVFTTFFNVIFP